MDSTWDWAINRTVRPANLCLSTGLVTRHASIVTATGPGKIADIYQAAINRAIQDHELDKLFNPDFYDYQI